MNKPPASIYDMRTRIYNALVTRKSLGDFDTHASTILLILEGLLAVINHQIERDHPDDK